MGDFMWEGFNFEEGDCKVGFSVVSPKQDEGDWNFDLRISWKGSGIAHHSGGTVYIDNLNGLDFDEILYIINHEIDHWAQNQGRFGKGTFTEKLFYILADVKERANCFAQQDWLGMYYHSYFLDDMRHWAKNDLSKYFLSDK